MQVMIGHLIFLRLGKQIKCNTEIICTLPPLLPRTVWIDLILLTQKVVIFLNISNNKLYGYLLLSF